MRDTPLLHDLSAVGGYVPADGGYITGGESKWICRRVSRVRHACHVMEFLDDRNNEKSCQSCLNGWSTKITGIHIPASQALSNGD